MEFKLTLPGGAVLEYRKEPMSWDKFLAVCVLIGMFMVGSGFLKLLELTARR